MSRCFCYLLFFRILKKRRRKATYDLYNSLLLAFSLLCLYFILFVLTHRHRLDHSIPLSFSSPTHLHLFLHRFRSQQLTPILRSLNGPKPISRSCFLSLVVSKPPFPYRGSSDIFPNLVFVVYLPVFCPILSEILTWNFLTIYLYLF